MRTTRLLLCFCGITMATTSCYVGASDTTSIGGPGSPGSNAGSSGSTSAGSSGSASAVDPTTNGLPCEVTALLQHDCAGCHSSPPSGGAPEALLTRADLTRPAKTDPTKSVGELSVTRIDDGSMPPKPAPAPDPALVTALRSWVAAGMPESACASPIDAGAPVKSPYDTPVQCTTGTTGTTREGHDMQPGLACISCHQQSGEAPLFAVAGTVFQTAHEPDDCNGGNPSEALTVVVMDANGMVVNLPVSTRSGNFSYEGALALPYAAKVVSGTAERPMVEHQTSGDCNSCHTVSGANGAPGRIMAP